LISENIEQIRGHETPEWKSLLMIIWKSIYLKYQKNWIQRETNIAESFLPKNFREIAKFRDIGTFGDIGTGSTVFRLKKLISEIA
jgi:hypothetical protein